MEIGVHGNKEGEVQLGTTIMGVVYDGGVLLAADCRTTRGSYIFDGMSDKVVIVTDNIFALTSGSAADTRILTKMVQYSLGVHQAELDQAPRVKTAARLYQQMMYQYKDSLSASLLLGGYDNQESKIIKYILEHCLYQCAPGGSVFKCSMAIGGSGSGFIYGYCDKMFREGMTYHEARQFAVEAVSLAIARDGSSGGGVRLMNITKQGYQREIVNYDQLHFQK